MKQHFEKLLQKALNHLQEAHQLPVAPPLIELQATKDKKHGDFASNIAMILAKTAQKNPREVAEMIVKALPKSPYLTKVEIAGAGFINFFLSDDALCDSVRKILDTKAQYGCCQIGRSKRVLIEFVSSNPTGPLHVGHGRHAAFGDTLANLLAAVGFVPYREYYLNDAGRQTDILAISILLRYLSLKATIEVYPANAYQGDYIIDIAKQLLAKEGMDFSVECASLFQGLPKYPENSDDQDVYMDALIARAKHLLGERYEQILLFAIDRIVTDMREDLAEFGVIFQNWFSERAFVASGYVDMTIQKLQDGGHVYDRDGALWFRSTDFGDTKDRVLTRSNGERTYFANDMAYHINKFERGFDIAITIFGSDHHGYTARMRAAMQAYGLDCERLIQLLVQFVNLYQGGKQLQMSTRGGTFITLRTLRHEVGNDVARFFYIMRKSEQPMDFDLDLAKAHSNENPVYYIQYAYARICSVFKQLTERGLHFDEREGLQHLAVLKEPEERQLLSTLSRYPDMIIDAALQYGPHILAQYIRDLAADFHAYYNAHQFLVKEDDIRQARLALIAAVRQVLANSLNLIGISTPESM